MADRSSESFDRVVSGVRKEFLAMAKLLWTSTLPESSMAANFVFSPPFLAVTLFMVVKVRIAIGTGEGEDGTAVMREFEWFTDSWSSSLASRIWTEFFLGGHRSWAADRHFWLANWNKHTASDSMKRAFRAIYHGLDGFLPQFDATHGREVYDTLQTVNSLVTTSAKGMIEGVFPVQVDTVAGRELVLGANWAYFNGAWLENFDASDPVDNDFYVKGGSRPAKVPFMTSKNPQLLETFAGFKVVGIPYEDGRKHRLFMYILLPDARDGLADLIQKITSCSGFILEDHLPTQRRQVNEFRIPEFSISFGIQDSSTLKLSSMRDAFLSVAREEKSMGKGTEMPATIPDIYKSSSLELDAGGTAAASVCSFSYEGVREKLDFVADHPFVFLIKEDETGLICFMGHVVDPRDG